MIAWAFVAIVGTTAATAEFKALRVTRSFEQIWMAEPGRTFSLLGPAEEAKWAQGWAPTALYPHTDPAVQDAVFLTAHEPDRKIWVLFEWDRAARRVGYFNVLPGSHATTIRISLKTGAEKTTRATVTYVWTGLSEAGNAWVAQHTPQRFEAEMRNWQDAINHYLRTGTLLKHHGP